MLTLLRPFVSPILRRRLDHQLMMGARNQAFVTGYVVGMETVKALQLEPQLDKRYGRCLADYLSAGFRSPCCAWWACTRSFSRPAWRCAAWAT